MIDYTYKKYENTMKYPGKKDYQKLFVYSSGFLLYQGPVDASPYSIDTYVTEIITDEVAYKTARNVYYEIERQKMLEFENDVYEEFGVMRNPKKELLYNKAWDRGHPGGLSDVVAVFADLVDLIR